MRLPATGVRRAPVSAPAAVARIRGTARYRRAKYRRSYRYELPQAGTSAHPSRRRHRREGVIVEPPGSPRPATAVPPRTGCRRSTRAWSRGAFASASAAAKTLCRLRPVELVAKQVGEPPARSAANAASPAKRRPIDLEQPVTARAPGIAQAEAAPSSVLPPRISSEPSRLCTNGAPAAWRCSRARGSLSSSRSSC
jgi:hypothetical protein